jgi:hypothetical protein
VSVSSCRASGGSPSLPPCVNCPACARAAASAASYRPTPWWHAELEALGAVAKVVVFVLVAAAAFGGCALTIH